jgi:hypothetical protein
MAKLPDGQISKHPTKGYRLTLGKYLKSGKPTPRLFWLGHNLGKAQFRVAELQRAYQELRGEGQEFWTDRAITDAKGFMAAIGDDIRQSLARLRENIEADQNRVAFLNGFASFAMPPAAGDPIKPEPESVGTESAFTLATAVAEYTAHLERKVPHQLSRTNCNRQMASLKCLNEVIPSNMLMAQVDKQQLEKLVAHFTARPVREQTGKPLAPDTVVTTLKHAKAFFDWLDGERWEAPRRMDKVFKVRRNILLTTAEQRAEANGKEVFSLDELKALYAHANEQQQLYMLVALNCAFTQKDLATITFADVQLDAALPIINLIRHKTRGTGIRGQWELWPETAAALRKRMRHTPTATARNSGQLALLTEDDRPLVNDANDTDSVGLTWRRLIKSINKQTAVVRDLPFKTIRKTASDTILKLSGSEAVQQLMLAHARRSIAARHYTGEQDFTLLAKPLQRFHAMLKNAGMFDVHKAKSPGMARG